MNIISRWLWYRKYPINSCVEFNKVFLDSHGFSTVVSLFIFMPKNSVDENNFYKKIAQWFFVDSIKCGQLKGPAIWQDMTKQKWLNKYESLPQKAELIVFANKHLDKLYKSRPYLIQNCDMKTLMKIVKATKDEQLLTDFYVEFGAKILGANDDSFR